MIEIGRIWEDDDFFELVISASNGVFAGRTDFYATTDELNGFIAALEGFPSSTSDTRSYEFGSDHRGNLFSLRLECEDAAGHAFAIATLVNAAGRVLQSVTLTVPVVASDIDRFCEQLEPLCRGKAISAQLGSANS